MPFISSFFIDNSICQKFPSIKYPRDMVTLLVASVGLVLLNPLMMNANAVGIHAVMIKLGGSFALKKLKICASF